MKEDKYTKSLAKNQVYAIVHLRDIQKNVLPNCDLSRENVL